MSKTLKYQFILHLIVLIWGLTGILGDMISLNAIKIVFFRTLIAYVSLEVLGFFIKRQLELSKKQVLTLIGVGIIVGLHWLTFFYAIKISTISIGVVCMSMSTLFTSFLEPIFFKRKLSLSEIIISLFILLGIILIFGFERQYKIGIIVGLTSAFLAALFTVLNGKLIHHLPSYKITKYEMFGALIVSFVFFYFSNGITLELFKLNTLDLSLLFFLGIICTSLAFLISVWVMNHLTPFTVSLSVNMEPIYTIIIAIILFPNQEKMTLGFYIGGSIIILSILTNAIIKKKSQKN
jgi:drug/metabolite transporter (DMT)-like permease